MTFRRTMVQQSGRHQRLWVGSRGQLVIAGSQPQPAGFQRWTIYRRNLAYAWCFTVLCYRNKINIYCFIALCVQAPQCSWANQMFFVFFLQHSSCGPLSTLSSRRPDSFTTTTAVASAELPAEEGEYWFFQCAAVIFLLLRDNVSWAGPLM